MHEYQRLIQSELDARGWTVSELARRAGMHRQTVNKIVKDERSHIGQMPDDATIERLAGALAIPAERLARAAARSLVGGDVVDNDDPLASYTVDFLMEYTRRRHAEELAAAREQARKLVDADAPAAEHLADAARTVHPSYGKGRGEQGEAGGEESQDG